MSTQTLREFINRHNASAAGLTALAAALDARATGTPLVPALAARVDELLGALGGANLLDDVAAQDVGPFLAELRFTHAVEARLLRAKTRAISWSYSDPEILDGPGAVSGAQAQGLARMVIPSLEGLAARMDAPGATFLDVGVGVAGLSIAMARLWPHLSVTGIEPWQPSLARARTNVDAAGLADRIELRERCAEDLEDEAAFDLAWIPIPFMPERVVPEACTRVHRALRPGGWALISMTNPGAGDPQTAALARLRTTLFGGGLFATAQIEQLLRDAGLVDVRTLPSPPGSIMAFVAGRRR